MVSLVVFTWLLWEDVAVMCLILFGTVDHRQHGRALSFNPQDESVFSILFFLIPTVVELIN